MPIPNDINPGIVETVKWLRSKGFNTCDSGDGETHQHECDMPVPYVHMTVSPVNLISETARLRDELFMIGVEVLPQAETGDAPSIEASWNPVELIATISLFNVKLTAEGKEQG